MTVSKVMKDYDTFAEVAEQYQRDEERVNAILDEFAGRAGGIGENVKVMIIGDGHCGHHGNGHSRPVEKHS